MGMTDAQKDVMTIVQYILGKDENPTEEKIKEEVDKCSVLTPGGLTDGQKQEVIRELQKIFQIHIDRGTYVVAKEHAPWYSSARAEIDPKFWNRYEKYLKMSGWALPVIRELNSATNEMMDELGNPQQSGNFLVRGLCIGEVQSGKTSNYIALINKAADAGYKIFILLTGSIEKLRSQTQERIDLGFIGADSVSSPKSDQVSGHIGVGLYGSDAQVWTVTTREQDFKASTAKAIIGQLDQLKCPVIFVLKKNNRILNNLVKWLTRNNKSASGKIELPMLLIDDEADNASINTKTSEDPTAINKSIRKLLELFSKTSYVGFTATPYANIFIDPDSEKEMIGDDLFPENFIYALTTPSNYIGAKSMFLDEDEADDGSSVGKYACILRDNDDCEEYLPLRHKINFHPVKEDMPKSLKCAILSFFLANAIRDIRGDTKAHRTMMINVSKFTDVQDRVKRQVYNFVEDYKNAIESYYKMGKRALEHEEFQNLKEVYEEEFLNFHVDGEKSRITYSWDTIQKRLKAAVIPIQVESIHKGNATKKLNYDEYKETGLRLIAVGGLSLSRGLTLEGLCTSYFYRNSKMYDTLMQMGRWFGYRNNYDDLCRVWMSDESRNWYSQITVATEELRNKILVMRDQGKTPKDFGLCVRQDKTALMVTARNKMRTAGDYERTIVISGEVVETKYLNTEYIDDNRDLTEDFIREISSQYEMQRNNDDLALANPQFLNVPAEKVIHYLGNYKSDLRNMDFQTEELCRIIKDSEKELGKWDIAIATGRKAKSDKLAKTDAAKSGSTTIRLGGIELSPVLRGFVYKEDQKVIQVSGAKARLGDKGMARAGLTKDMLQSLESSGRKLISEKSYFDEGIERNPLLVIYPVELYSRNRDNDTPEKIELIENTEVPVIGLSVGIPFLKGHTPVRHKYKINRTMQRMMLEEDGDLDDDDISENYEED